MLSLVDQQVAPTLPKQQTELSTPSGDRPGLPGFTAPRTLAGVLTSRAADM